MQSDSSTLLKDLRSSPPLPSAVCSSPLISDVITINLSSSHSSPYCCTHILYIINTVSNNIFFSLPAQRVEFPSRSDVAMFLLDAESPGQNSYTIVVHSTAAFYFCCNGIFDFTVGGCLFHPYYVTCSWDNCNLVLRQVYHYPA